MVSSSTACMTAKLNYPKKRIRGQSGSKTPVVEDGASINTLMIGPQAKDSAEHSIMQDENGLKGIRAPVVKLLGQK